MTRSVTERMKAYRERLKQKGLYEAHKERNKIQQQKSRGTISSTIRRRQNRQYKRKQRGKKIATGESSSNVEEPSESAETSLAFSTRQAFGKAMKRARNALPLSATKRKAVILTLAKEEGIIITTKERTYKRDTINQATVNDVAEFYNNDDISQQMPGMRDYVTIKKDGRNEKVQTRYMRMTLKEAYEKFIFNNFNIEIGFSKFADLRPAHVKLQKDTPHNMCLCKIHENMRLLLIAFQKKGVLSEINFRKFIEKTVCDQESSMCMLSSQKCSKCSGLKFLENVCEQYNNDIIEWKEWCLDENNKLAKISKEGTVIDCIGRLQEQYPKFLEHTFIKRKQSDYFRRKRESINKEECVVQVDFAENYHCLEQDEIQAAHWQYNQVTVFTVVVWFVEENQTKKIQSYVIVSDYMSHDKYSVHKFLEKIFSEIKTCLKKINVFSDGAPTQFKQKYNLCNLTHLADTLNVNITWNFFATSHGKGAVDAIGGEIKRAVRTKVRCGQSVQNSIEFVKALEDWVTHVKVLHISSEEITNSIAMLDEMWQDIRPIPSLQKVHCIETLNRNTIKYSFWAEDDKWKQHEFKNGDSEAASTANKQKRSRRNRN